MSLNNYSKEDIFNISMVDRIPMTIHFTPKSYSLRENREAKTVVKMLLSDTEAERIAFNIANHNRTYGLIKCMAVSERDEQPKEISFHTNDVHRVELRPRV